MTSPAAGRPIDRYGARMTGIIDAPTRSTGRNYVGGAWVPASSGETYTQTNPMPPSETVGEFSSSSEADADAAGAAPAQALSGCAPLAVAERPCDLHPASAWLYSGPWPVP